MLTASHINPWFVYHATVKENPWAVTVEAETTILTNRLHTALTAYTNLKFDHLRIGHLGRRVCVFVVKGNQSAVLYDKTKGFPSAKLLASLLLLGS